MAAPAAAALRELRFSVEAPLAAEAADGEAVGAVDLSSGFTKASEVGRATAIVAAPAPTASSAFRCRRSCDADMLDPLVFFRK
mmetsp:Transcript_5009/g.11053  ORF Transcript_5009/g.11053 Transcript_5009/m.11053 type:complete len:83 (+) Transcript_5009:338-586(+)